MPDLSDVELVPVEHDPFSSNEYNPLADPSTAKSLPGYVIGSMVGGAGQLLTTPQRAYQQGLTPEQEVGFGANMAAGIMGIRTPFAKPGTLGVAGGRAALPMDEASRMARAAEQGFTRDAYRGEGAPLTGSEYEIGHPGRYDPGFLGSDAIYATNQPYLANDYATLKAAKVSLDEAAPNVVPLKVNMQNPLVISGKDKVHIASLGEDARNAWLQGVVARGHDGVIVRWDKSGMLGKGVTEEYAVPSPSQLRSRFAAFDPQNKGSANLLSQSGLPIVPPGSEPDQTIAPGPAQLIPGAAAVRGGEAAPIGLASNPLAATRSSFIDETNDPAVRERLMRLTEAEVGGQGPATTHAFMETVFNRAAARGQSLTEAMNDASYYPAVSLRGKAPTDRDMYGKALDNVLSGSNVSNYATGNASGRVMFAGGPQTYNPGTGDRFGREGSDLGWANSIGYAQSQSGVAPTDVSSDIITGPRRVASAASSGAGVGRGGIGGIGANGDLGLLDYLKLLKLFPVFQSGLPVGPQIGDIAHLLPVENNPYL